MYADIRALSLKHITWNIMILKCAPMHRSGKEICLTMMDGNFHIIDQCLQTSIQFNFILLCAFTLCLTVNVTSFVDLDSTSL